MEGQMDMGGAAAGAGGRSKSLLSAGFSPSKWQMQNAYMTSGWWRWTAG